MSAQRVSLFNYTLHVSTHVFHTFVLCGRYQQITQKRNLRHREMRQFAQVKWRTNTPVFAFFPQNNLVTYKSLIYFALHCHATHPSSLVPSHGNYSCQSHPKDFFLKGTFYFFCSIVQALTSPPSLTLLLSGPCPFHTLLGNLPYP